MKILRFVFIFNIFITLSFAFPGPELYSPGNNALILTQSITFSWSSHPTAHYYYIQIDNDANFSSVVYSNYVYGTSITLNSDNFPFADNTTYFWHVQTYAHDWWNPNNPYWSDWSAVLNFNLDLVDKIQINASDGQYDNIRISWNNLPQPITKIEILRDGQLWKEVNKSETINYEIDNRGDILQQKLYKYRLNFKDNGNTVWAYREDYGFRKPNGLISGDVRTQRNAGVPDVEVKATLIPSASSLTGSINLINSGTLITIPNYPVLNFPAGDITIEFWLKSSNIQNVSGYIFHKPNKYDVEIAIPGNIRFRVYEYNNTYWEVLSAATIVNNQWTHIAVTFQNGMMRIFINGEQSAQAGWHSFELNNSSQSNQDPLVIGGVSPVQLDEIRIWNTACSAGQLKINMGRTLAGDESGLIAYWRFNNGTAQIAADDAVGGGHHGNIQGNPTWYSTDNPVVGYGDLTDHSGYYSLYNIYYDENGSDFRIEPVKPGHLFSEPAERTLKTDQREHNITFYDNSSFTVSGSVSFNPSGCPAEGVYIEIDDQLTIARTDDNGEFSVSVTDAGQHKISPVLAGHGFVPAEVQIDVQNDMTGLSFSDTTTNYLRGTVTGGKAKFFIGEARLQVQVPQLCLNTTITTQGGAYLIKLPALTDITVTVIEIIGFTGQGYMQSSKTVSLAEGDQILDFSFYAEPKVQISGWPESNCSFAVLKQAAENELLLQVVEEYGDSVCISDSGTITIYDDLSDRPNPLEVELDSSGQYLYSFITGNPNFSAGGNRPYQKQLLINVQTRGGETEEEKWAIVTGYQPRQQTFVTVSPELPLLILHDPPGDGSYSYFDQSVSAFINTSLSFLVDASVETYSSARAGIKFEGGFLGFSTETDIWGSVGQSLTVGASLLSQTEHQLRITSSKKFQTSDNDEIIGSKSDVFIGAAFNMLYAITDILNVKDQCSVEISKGIVYGSDSLQTTYIYSELFIRNTLIPDLKRLREMTADPYAKQRYMDQIDVWEQTLAYNDKLKQNAIPIDDPLFKNISMNGGHAIEHSIQITESRAQAFKFNLYIDAEVAAEAGLEIAGSGFSAGVTVRASMEIGTSLTSGVETTNSSGFYLYDKDIEDFFSLDVKADPVYGTPVFDVAGGKSSCPWEENTVPRDSLKLTADKYVLNDIPADGIGGFNLQLFNYSQSFEEREYELVFLHQSNPDGAEIKINGVSVIVPLQFDILPNGVKPALLTVKRGPFAYDYHDLLVVMRSPCDYNIADTSAFDIHFTSPCSPVVITYPQNNWYVNQACHDSLQIDLAGYDLSRLSTLILQYSLRNQNSWQEALIIPVQNLTANNSTFYLTTQNIPDGVYDLRVKVIWDQAPDAIVYSNTTYGIIDRQPPRPFGSPQPADEILSSGDEISITFNEPINCTSCSAENVLLVNTFNGNVIPSEFTCLENKLVITPMVTNYEIENQVLQVSLLGVKDLFENSNPEAIYWSFMVNKNPVYWNVLCLDQSVFINEEKNCNATLHNSGIVEADITIEHCPFWLEPDFTSGTISAGARQNINFVLKGIELQIGNYIDTVYASTPQGKEPLIINLKVQAQPPDWQFDPGSFQYSMTVSAGFYIEDVPFSEENDLVAAVVGDEIRGRVEVIKIVPQDEYAAFLMVYSNQSRGEQVHFRIWDASEGVERIVSESFVFVNDTAYGSAIDLEKLHIADVFLQAVILYERWNWISLGVEAKNMSTESVLAYLHPDEGDLIKGQTGYRQYSPGSGWVGNLDTMEIGNSFKVKLATPAKLNFIGVPVSIPDRPISILNGWNWIGYLPDIALNLNDALINYQASAGDIIKSKSAFASYGDDQWIGSLQEMIPGEGYMLKSSQITELYYPGASGKAKKSAGLLSAHDLIQNAPAWYVNPVGFEHTMNMTGILSIDGVLNSSAQTLLAAFVNDECRGVGKPLYVDNKWYYFMTIYATGNGELITFKIWDAILDDTKEIAQTLLFTADSVLGSPGQPFQWQTGVPTSIDENINIPLEFALTQNYPNPFNPATKIRYALKQPEEVRLVLFNALGQVVKVLVDEKQKAGWYELEFNGSNLASGVYFYKLSAGKFKKTCKMILVK